MIKTTIVRIYNFFFKWRKGRENEYECIVYEAKFNIMELKEVFTREKKTLIKIRYIIAI